MTRGQLGRDIIAGITLAALGIPEVMGYTKIETAMNQSRGMQTNRSAAARKRIKENNPAAGEAPKKPIFWPFSRARHFSPCQTILYEIVNNAQFAPSWSAMRMR